MVAPNAPQVQERDKLFLVAQMLLGVPGRRSCWPGDRPALATVLSAWFDGRSGRVVRLNIGERQVEARSTEEAKSFLRRAQRLLAKPLEFGELRP